MQNVPKHDKDAQRIVRRALKPKPGYMWMEVDYSGIEVRTTTCYHKDPVMIQYLKDPASDMHRDTASDIFMLPPEDITKALRQGGKNGFVFPQFYGDYYGNNAPHLWHDWVLHPDDGKLNDGSTVKDHLQDQGIHDLSDFTQHVKSVEDYFWGVRFKVYKKWKERQLREYHKKGYIRSYTGFKYTAPMSKNDVTNYAAQGSAFHCLLWSLTRINARLMKEGWKSYIVGQIHDAIDLAVWPPELPRLIPMLKQIMVDELMSNFKWVIVPMDVEFDLGPVNGSWYDVKGISERDIPCMCGLEWGYKSKDKEGNTVFTCPICDYAKE